MIQDTQLADDGYDFDPAAQTSTGNAKAVLMPGVYKMTGTILPRTRDGVEVLQSDDRGNEWPLYVIPSVEITDEMGRTQKYDVWHEVATRPTNYGDPNRPLVSDAAQLLAALDANLAATATSFTHVKELLRDNFLNMPVTFDCSTGLTARDSNLAKQIIAERNLKQPADRKEINKVWRSADLKTKDFAVVKGTKGNATVFATTVKGKSGALLTAKTTLSRFIPSNADGVVYGVGQFPPR